MIRGVGWSDGPGCIAAFVLWYDGRPGPLNLQSGTAAEGTGVALEAAAAAAAAATALTAVAIAMAASSWLGGATEAGSAAPTAAAVLGAAGLPRDGWRSRQHPVSDSILLSSSPSANQQPANYHFSQLADVPASTVPPGHPPAPGIASLAAARETGLHLHPPSTGLARS